MILEMIVDWFIILTIFRVIFALVILGLASYLDIKTRMAPNKFWVIMGLVGISLIECQFLLELGLNAFQHILPIIPVTILFMSFLVCEWMVDFEKRKINEPWLFLIALAAYIFLYLFLLRDPFVNDAVQNYQLFAPIILFLLYFIMIEIIINYSEYRSYHKYLMAKSKSAAKNKSKTISAKGKGKDKTKAHLENSKSPDTEIPGNKLAAGERFSWALFFGLLGSTIIIFLMVDIITIKVVRQTGYILLIFIPIMLIILYLMYQPHESSEVDEKAEEGDSEEPLPEVNIQDYSPSRIIYIFSFFGLIFFGFVVIIYYATIEQLSNVMVQTFILMVWILIFYGFYNFGLPRGGADTKALMALVLIFPAYPIIQFVTIHTSFYSLLDEFTAFGYLFPFAFSVLINAAFIMLFFVIGLLIYNSSKRNLKFPHALLGYKIPIKQVPLKFVWLMEKMQDGKRKLVAFPGAESDLENELEKLRSSGIKNVWVTPKIPFLIPLTIGLVLTLIFGNIIFLIFGI